MMGERWLKASGVWCGTWCIGCVHACEVTSVMPDSLQPYGGIFQAPLSLGFSRQGYWSAFPYPPPGCRPNPGIKPTSLTCPALAGKFCSTSATWETLNKYSGIQTNIWSWKANTPSEVDLPASQGNPLAYQPQGQNCFIFFFTNFSLNQVKSDYQLWYFQDMPPQER